MQRTRIVDRAPDRLRRVRPYAEHAAAALLSAVSVGLLLAILGGLLPAAGVEVETAAYWRFGIAASLVGGNLIALAMARQERRERRG